ncbi:MAG: A/G-specific adenine glycosylase [Candidatus Yanofskybacteria bacterium]|nr:A/G-specific adenine glycosylase [Candidatus Yanofskybacteria bacterium]
MDHKKFQKLVWDFYRAHGRDLAWRKTRDPYHIVVSEIMLQQTQVERVKTKYEEFLKTFPTWQSLCRAPAGKVLKVWQGLGYNRRALALKKISEVVVKRYKGKLPDDPELLETLPGIGRATAGSIAAFAFNKPVPFIETNIRRVYLHHFFPHKNKVSDDMLSKLVSQTVSQSKAGEWYYALMDYGSMLAKQIENPNRRSKHYTKQSKFEGSNRQLRGAIVRELVNGRAVGLKSLADKLNKSVADISPVILELQKDGFVKYHKNSISLQ